ncbi:hypothetical protein [Arenimonas composti]|uniref:Uncharacterized protein n=1 Tax=Arenimonas composti TR7-09 = DSM 18010 TaxID=1121013 RepID=A0A091BD80_9GAMM|nr:hypothetical protein [Arenimonas composti]KFN49706.1 hypothetical protein P873_09115 [Arenimonas composti TR7-09 = DSM 18010]
MDFLLKLLTQWRRMMLTRQAAAVRRAVEAMTPEQRRQTADHTLNEIRAAAALPLPHLYGDTSPSMYRPWSPVAEICASRVDDRAIQLRQRSVGTWLAVVYHETRTAQDEGLQAVHRDVLGILRTLKETRAGARADSAWFDAAA